MIHNEPYYIDPNNPDDWRKAVKDAAYITLFFIIGMLLCALFNSCATQTEFIEKTDTMYVSKTDTVSVTSVTEKKVTEYIDRWRDNTIVINPLTGDTTKQIIKEGLIINYSKEQHDSIDRYRAMCDSLMRVRNNTKEVVKEKQLSWWERFKIDTYIYVLIAFLATIATLLIRYIIRMKPP